MQIEVIYLSLLCYICSSTICCTPPSVIGHYDIKINKKLENRWNISKLHTVFLITSLNCQSLKITECLQNRTFPFWFFLFSCQGATCVIGFGSYADCSISHMQDGFGHSTLSPSCSLWASAVSQTDGPAAAGQLFFVFWKAWLKKKSGGRRGSSFNL